MLELRQVSRQWQEFRLGPIDLRVAAGEYFVLLGPSGAGKSLLLELVAGFHSPTSGRILIEGQDVTRRPPEERRIGFVHQQGLLFPHRTAWANVAYGPRLRGLSRGEAGPVVERLASMLRIEHVLPRRPGELSGGEKQRVAIARALATEPRLLLADEPLGALDPPTQRELRAELKRVHQATGLTVVHVTHNQEEARELGDKIGVMKRGRLVQVGSAREVFERPAGSFVAEFTGCRNLYEGLAAPDGDATVFKTGSLTLVSTARASGPARAAVRPENIIISTEPVKTSARNQLAGRVRAVLRQGSVFAVTADCDGREMTALVTPHSLEQLGIRPGSRAYFSFKAHSVHLMSREDEPDD
ncbi:MAG: ATP-binding cassette domain-containing protein [Planctomycetota bacterium]|jgi:molybdate/tungstate transport system ATP-binding protein